MSVPLAGAQLRSASEEALARRRSKPRKLLRGRRNALAAHPAPRLLWFIRALAMPVLPKSFIVLGAGLQTARTRRQLRRRQTSVPAQSTAFRSLIARFARTEFGRDHGIEASLDYARFRDRVPLRSYEQFAPYLDRMKRGEADVLWPGQCSFYAISSGTTAERAKWLPITGEMLAHFREAELASLFFYTARVGNAGVFRGRHLFLGGATALSPVPAAKPFAAFSGDLSGITALSRPAWAERHLYEPGPEIAQMTDWTQKIQAIVDRTRRRNITLLAGVPSWLLMLGDALREAEARSGRRIAHLQELWPNLECLVHGGVPLAPFADELRRAVGPSVNFHEIFPAAAGFIAAQDADSSAGLRLFADKGLFFEFLPCRDYDPALPPNLGAKAVPLEQVRVGEDYVLLLTTPAGLCRYALGDVVRFTSVEPPRLIYVGRTKLQLNAFGEHAIEKELTDALVAVCQRHHWTITNFHVAPLAVNSLTGQQRGRHEWWIELKPGTVETPTGPLLAGQLDTELMGRNDDYATKRKTGALEAPFVRLVMPGFFEHWLRHHGKLGGQHKMPRCRSDREIADELSAMACFNAD